MTRPPCPTFEELSQLFSAKNREMIASHLATCEACAGVWADLEALREAAQQIPTRTPTAAEAIHLEDRLLSAALAPAPTAPKWRRFAAPLAAAAVAAGVTLFFTARPDDAPRTAVVQAPAGAQFEHFTRVEHDAPREVVRVREGRVSIEATDEAAPLEVLTADGTIEVQSSDFEVVVVDDRLSEVFVRSGQVEVRTPDGTTHIVRLGERWTRPARAPGEGGAPSVRAAKVDQADAEAGAGGTTTVGASQPTAETALQGAGALATRAGTSAREGEIDGALASARTGAGAGNDGASASPRRDGASASSRTGAGAGGIAGARSDGASAASRRGAGAGASAGARSDGASASSSRGAGAGAHRDSASSSPRTDGASSRTGAGAGGIAGARSDGASASSRTGAERAGASQPSRAGVASASSRAGASRVGVGSASSRADGVSPASSGREAGSAGPSTRNGAGDASSDGAASSRTAAGAASPGASASASDSQTEPAGPGSAPPASGDGAASPDAGTMTPPLPTPAERAFASGWRLLRAGEAVTAAERFAEVVEHQPGGALAEDARYWRAAALAKADAAEATPALRAYLAAHPEGRRAAEVTLMLAWRRLADGDEAEAKALFERAAAIGDARVKKAARRGLDQL